MDNFTIPEIEMRLFICKKALEWLHSSDPMLRDPQYAVLVPGAIENYTSQFNELVEARRVKLAEEAQPVRVGLGTAKLTQKVIRRNGNG